MMVSLTSKTTHFRDSSRLVSGNCECEAAETYLGLNRGDAMKDDGVIEDRAVCLDVNCDGWIVYKGELAFAR